MLVCALLPAAATASVERLPTAIGQRADVFVPGEAIVRFKPAASAAARREARSEAGVEFTDTLGLPRAQVVSVDGSVETAVRRLERQPGVAYAQPNYLYEALAASPPNDKFFDRLWGLSDPALPEPGVGVLEAWEDNKGSGQVIAVLDTGVDLTHPDIIGNLWANPSPNPDDLHGYDFVDNDGDPDDYDFHGTHVAGTAAATAENGEGVAGVAPEAQIMAVRVLDGDGSGTTVGIAAGIDYAAEHDADVINLSLSGPSGAEDKVMSDAVKVAAAADAVVVAAAGNEGVSNDLKPRTPCALPEANLICVAALNQSGGLAGFSNYGAKSVDLAAPGTSILSAKTDYGAPLFSDGFEPGLEPLWTTQAFDGGKEWDLSDSAAEDLKSAADSPAGGYGQQEPGAEGPAASELFSTAAVDLTGERGCRLHFKAKYQIESFFDVFFAGAITEIPTFDGLEFDGASPGFPATFTREQVSISDLGGRSDVRPIFAVFSDEEVELDGAYVDAVRVFCRDETYVDEEATSGDYDQPESGNYVRFQGTSMAAPHVAGLVALVRAAAPGLSAQEIVDAVLDGASAIPSIVSGKRTATEGIADACKAIAVATGGDIEAECPFSSEPTPQPPAGGGALPPTDGDADPPPSTPEPPIGPKPLPHTFFRQHPPRVLRTPGRSARAVFRFGASVRGVTFVCRVDRGPYRPCPPRFVRWFGLGSHVLRVKARDADGNVDRTPAAFRFTVKQRG